METVQDLSLGELELRLKSATNILSDTRFSEHEMAYLKEYIEMLRKKIDEKKLQETSQRIK